MVNSTSNVEIPPWLRRLPLAPEFRPTDTEFADPIAYISRIEKEASAFGICKIIPPLPKPSKKYVFSNLNKSLIKCPDFYSDIDLSNLSNMPKNGSRGNGDDGEARAVFTTRQQELGQSVRKTKGVGNSDNPLLAVHKQVWQSGEVYTLEQFESKSKTFAKSVLGKEASPLVVEGLFWKAASAKPIYIEYANDVPGSGFGEPEGQFRYYCRRRRKMKSWKSFRSRGKSECEHDDVESVKNFRNDETRDASVKNDPSISSETPNSSTASSTIHVDDNQGSNNARLRRKSVSCNNDVEGTAGWKLSNSPWNLQVISRSPGSLTRFMPDDIPGVTSPMVYIGMLFSWFAWHVEDHELHSMNFLHTGAPKTWYAVPGDYAFTFEETIRSKAYGGNIDRLAALTLLGEKTTLLSPEVIVASGIPCCRLIQYPGEFVVTFPRAYHVGFSHGFNCGEAANFGTPQWLKVAKEAAVRRAAMNYLPMLSHQQLLYLLTMSFVSRVPRSLLPGARSSRLRDRQKEERELLVKKAFVEDILKENHTLSVLLGRNETIYAVLWNPDLLPCTHKESQLPILTDTTTPAESGSHTRSKENNKESNLVDEMSLYMETLKAMDLEDDDVSSDFQIDSGPLACVACGILGFPFMSVVQVSERASTELELIDQSAVGEARGVPEHKDLNTFTQTDGSIQSSVSADVVPVPSKDSVIPSATKLSKKWNTCSKYLKPRIFCLEHAVQIEELLRSKGGANILVICHSDFQKIRANAAAVAEEIHTPFDLKNVPLGNASEEDLHLIDLAIDDSEHDEFTEDWTSKLGINLRYCVKVRKNAPSKRVHHALSLGDLFSDTSSNFSEIRWQARKSRSKIRLNHPVNSRPCQSMERKAEEVSVETSTAISSEKEKKVIQYTRRKFKLKSNFSIGASSSATYNSLDQHSLNHVPSRVAKSPPTATLAIDSVGPNEKRTLEDTDSKCEERTVVDADVNREKSETCAERCHGDQVMAANDNLESCGLDQAMENENIMNENGVCDRVTSGNEVRQDMVVYNRTSKDDENEEEGLCNDNNMNQPTEVFAAENFCNNSVQKGTDENLVLSSLRVTVQPDSSTKIVSKEEFVSNSSTKSESKEEFVSSSVTRMEVEFSSSRLAKGLSKEEESCADDMALDLEARSESQTTSDTSVDVPVSSSSLRMEERRSTSEVPRGMFAEENLSSDVAVDDELCENDGTAVATNEDSEPGSLTLINHPHPVNIKKYSPKDSKISAESNSTKGTKRKREIERKSENEFNFSEFIRSPCEGLRPRSGKIAADTSANDISRKPKEKISATKTVNKPSKDSVPPRNKKKIVKEYDHKCDLDGCHMSFKTKKELSLHKRNRCPVEGCGKKFSSHKYAIIHQRVHDDDRPLKCPWKGCHMSFKWAWARTEHIRVHTGERPYKCKVEGCGLSFRFVSDISRHRRKTGHYEK